MSTACPACRADNRQGNRFCTNCGNRLPLACPACGSPSEPDDRFCGQCGTALTPAAASPAVAASAAAPAPAHPVTPPPADAPAAAPLAEIPSRTGSEAERKQLTVLFADVKGSMDLQESLDPEEWAAIMDQFVRILAAGVHRFGGTVDKFTGDGMMALFGAPIALEDHAGRACLAALHLVQAIADYADELRRTGGPDFHVRLGLNSGEVVVGRVGDDLHLDPTALGHAVGLAQRMEALAEPGRAYLSEYTARLVEGSFALTNLGPTAVKGVRDPLRVFVLDGTASRSARQARTAAPLVGRSAELAVLEDALAQAGEGTLQVVGIVGEAGVGKSRLCEEFIHSVAERGITVRRTTGVSHGRDVPLLPVLALVRDYFDITEADSPVVARERIEGRLLALDPELTADMPLFFDFLEVPDPDRPGLKLAPEVRMRRFFEVLRKVIERRSERETLVFLIEDIQWFDPQSEAFLERLLASFVDSRTLVLANFRPEFTAPWLRDPSYRQLSLSRLPDAAVGQLLGGLLGVDMSLAPLVAFVSERTGGNPFFVEEVVRALLEDGTLAGSPSAYRLTRPLQEIRVPPSVHAVLAARIDRLNPGHKALLQTAAVIGRSFSEPVLARVCGEAAANLEDPLATLCSAELLQVTGEYPATEYRFWHALTQEVAYGTLMTRRRAELHAAVARALAERDPDRLDETAAVLARHWERAGNRLEAARWNVRAAGFALRSDIGEALRRWQAAVDFLEGTEETPDSLALGVRARIRLLQFGARTGVGAEKAERMFQEGLALAERSGDIGLRGMLTVSYGATSAFTGDVVSGLARCREAAELGEEATNPDVKAALLVPLAFTLGYVGPLPEALAAADRVVAVCDGDPARGASVLGHGVLARALQFRASTLARMGQLPNASEAVELSIALARPRAEMETLCWALSVPVQIAWLSGEPADLATASEAVRLGEDTGNVAGFVLGLESVALAHLGAGEPGEAVAACERALDEARRRNSGLFAEAALLAVLAQARLGMGDHGGADTTAEEAVAVARRQGAHVLEVPALVARARVRRQAGRDEEALADLDAALALVRTTGALAWEPFIREELGLLGADDSQLKEALRLFTAMGATGHARRLEADLFPASG